LKATFFYRLGIKQKLDATSGYTLAPIGLRVFEKPAEVNLTGLVQWETRGIVTSAGGEPPAGLYFIDPLWKTR